MAASNRSFATARAPKPGRVAARSDARQELELLDQDQVLEADRQAAAGHEVAVVREGPPPRSRT